MIRSSDRGATDHGDGKKRPSWWITLIRNSSGVRIGTVEAVTAEEAIKIAIRNYSITDPEQQSRLVAQRTERISSGYRRLLSSPLSASSG